MVSEELSPQERLHRLALDAVGPLLSQRQRRQLAQRLPRDLGHALWERDDETVAGDHADAVSFYLREAESWSEDP